MNQQFKNRLVGTIVLVILGVILLPSMLSGKKVKEVEAFTEIPLRQMKPYKPVESQTKPQDDLEQFEVEEVPLGEEISTSAPKPEPQKEQPKVVQPAAVKPAAVKPAETKPAVVKPAVVQPAVVKPAPVKVIPNPVIKPVEKPKQITAGFALQLGGFNNAANVRGLIGQLRNAGYSAYTEPSTPIEGRLTRVFVGPEESAAKLLGKQDAIFRLTGLKGKVVPYSAGR